MNNRPACAAVSCAHVMIPRRDSNSDDSEKIILGNVKRLPDAWKVKSTDVSEESIPHDLEKLRDTGGAKGDDESDVAPFVSSGLSFFLFDANWKCIKQNQISI